MAYYALIGIDGCGKSSVIKPGRESKYNAVFTREPHFINNPTKDPVEKAYSFAYDRHLHMEHIVEPALNYGRVVISDRCFICSLAYQGYDGLSLDWLMGIQPMNLIKPDLAIWLWCEPELAAKRSKEDPIRMKHIQDWYAEALEVAEVEYVKIDVTNMSKDELFKEVMRHVTN